MSEDPGDRLARARTAVAAVEDPELPALTIADLGILRDVTLRDGRVEVTITPTYTGCTAMAVIGWEIEAALDRAGLGPALVRTVLAPAWSTDALGPDARAKLAAAGIAPPPAPGAVQGAAPDAAPACPRCASARTELLSAFGATGCKSLHRCRDCREPFEAFKAH
ncbi:MAG: phenylacetate-CoA oxygenase subunit PaaJ [Rhodospirillales bacterium]|nr:phenylacetate-CoA oxygenase subunit PaaJ [Rhodospirillales bacterium]